MKQYDYLIVGAGIFGATFVYLAKQAGKRCLVIDKRPHTGGNTYCEDIDSIHVHKYGAHIFTQKVNRYGTLPTVLSPLTVIQTRPLLTIRDDYTTCHSI